MKVTAVIGAQYGSEGKGVVVNHIAKNFDVHVRVGGSNAGHSFVHNGIIYKMQMIPCGWTNPNATLIIGRGALISMDVLKREYDQLRALDPTIEARLLVDHMAAVVDPILHNEGHVGGELNMRIGSTGEGIGAARIARIQRDRERIKHFYQVAGLYGLEHLVHEDTPHLIRHIGTNVLLEGTQGVGLSLIHGPWPYVTSSDVGAAQLCSDAGVPPQAVTDVLMVCRTYPIRVAGNSGPLANELTWAEMSERLGRPVSEQTTVTKLTRRVGMWDSNLIRRTVVLNAPTQAAMMFLDYLDPKQEGQTHLTEASIRWIRGFEKAFDVPVRYAGVGGEGWKVIDL